MINMPPFTLDLSLYRVLIREEDIVVTGLGVAVFDNDLSGVYTRNTLPDTLEKNLSVLMTCDPTPPTTFVQGVGRRINEQTFWVM